MHLCSRPHPLHHRSLPDPRLEGGGILAAAGTGGGLAAFLWWEGRAKNPVFAVRAFAGNRVFTYSNIAALINYAATFAIGFLLSFYLQGVRGFTPDAAGILLVTQPVVMTIVVIFSGRLSDRLNHGFPPPSAWPWSQGALAGFALLGPETPLIIVAALLVIVGFGFGIFSSPNMNSIISALPDHAAGVASATAATMRVIGQMLSMAIAMMVFSIVIGGGGDRPGSHQRTPACGPGLFCHLCLPLWGGYLVLCRTGQSAGRLVPGGTTPPNIHSSASPKQTYTGEFHGYRHTPPAFRTHPRRDSFRRLPRLLCHPPFISSGVQIALPFIAAAFGVPPATLLGWVPTAFLLPPYAMFLLPFGKTADMLGRRPYFLVGIAVMGTGLICAGLAPSFGILMAGMAIAGFGSAMTFATALPLLTTNYPPLRERGKIIGINTAVVYVSLAAGPFFGGILTGFLGWRALFLATAPPVILTALVVGYSVIPKDTSSAPKRLFDYPGTVIYGISLILIIGGASRLPALWAAVLTLSGICGLVGFFFWETRADEPIFPVRLLRGNRAFTFSNIAALINYASTYAVTFLLSLYLQYVRLLSPPQAAGTILLAQPILMAVAAPVAGRLSDRIEPPRILATTGMGIVTACLFLLSFIGTETPVSLIMAVLMLLGLGYGIFSPPNMNSIMSSVGNAQAGVASATAATMRVLGQNLSMAVAMMAFSMVIGTVVITPPDITTELLTATKYAFTAFGTLCAAGVWFSAVRGGNLRPRPAEETT